MKDERAERRGEKGERKDKRGDETKEIETERARAI